MDIYLTPDGDLVCEDCGVQGDMWVDSASEADAPHNCALCGMPLGNALTSEGVRYVIERAKEECLAEQHIIPKKGTAEEDGLSYYHGSPHKAIVLDWLAELHWYNFDSKVEARVNRLVEILRRK